jgi:hypothetical protein
VGGAGAGGGQTGGGVNLRRGAGVVLAAPVLTSPPTGLRLLLGEA